MEHRYVHAEEYPHQCDRYFIHQTHGGRGILPIPGILYMGVPFLCDRYYIHQSGYEITKNWLGSENKVSEAIIFRLSEWKWRIIACYDIEFCRLSNWKSLSKPSNFAPWIKPPLSLLKSRLHCNPCLLKGLFVRDLSLPYSQHSSGQCKSKIACTQNWPPQKLRPVSSPPPDQILSTAVLVADCQLLKILDT